MNLKDSKKGNMGVVGGEKENEKWCNFFYNINQKCLKLGDKSINICKYRFT